MYRPLEPHVRELVHTVLVAALRFDVRALRISQVMTLGIDTMLRSDVVVDSLMLCLGATLNITRRNALKSYNDYLILLSEILEDPNLIAEHPTLDDAVELLDKTRNNPTTFENAVLIAVAEQTLGMLEALAHSESQGPFSLRTKRRLLDHLTQPKIPSQAQAQAGPLRIDAPQLDDPPAQAEQPLPVFAAAYGAVEPLPLPPGDQAYQAAVQNAVQIAMAPVDPLETLPLPPVDDEDDTPF